MDAFSPDACKPTALLVTCPDESDLANPYAEMLFTQAYQSRVAMFERGDFEGKPNRGLEIFVDEAARFPKSRFSAIMAAGRSRNVHLHLALLPRGACYVSQAGSPVMYCELPNAQDMLAAIKRPLTETRARRVA